MKAQDISADRLRDFFNTFAELMEQMTGSNPQGISIKTVAEEMLIAKARAGKSPAYLKTLRAQTASAFKGNLRKSIAEVTLPDMEKWFFRSEYARRTQRNFGLAARTLFSFAQKRGYVRNNVAEGLEMPTLENRPVEIMPVEHVALALHTAQKTDLNLCRLLAIQFFAGLRTSEAHRLIESEIGERFIEVKAEKCKTRRRMVTIQPALRAWLSIGGELPLRQAWTRQAAFHEQMLASGVLWPRNACRHSFCSYHLAQFENAGKTALEAGHSEAMLFAHYREIVTPEAAQAFWDIRPK